VAGGGVTLFSAPDAWVAFSQPWRSALRAGVLSSCFAKKKVAKEEGDPRVGAPFGGPLRYSASRAAAELGPVDLKQSSPKAPGQPALLSAFQGDPKSVQEQATTHVFDYCGHPPQKPRNASIRFSPDAFPGPLRGAEQRRSAGGSRRALFEGRSPELRSRPAFRVAQGTRRRRAPTQGWPFLWLLSFGHTKESTPASRAETQANSSHKRGTHRKSNPVYQNHSPEKH
jgi:hypothetical protein